LVSTLIKDPIEESIGFFTALLYYPLKYIMQFLFSKTPKSGAQTSIYCASEPTLEKSKDVYFQLVNSVGFNHLGKYLCILEIVLFANHLH
jgi:hypothetical protein